MKPSELTSLLQVLIQARAPVLVTGAPGIGKSDVVAQAADAAGAHLVIEHPVVSDPTDYKGLPFASNGGAEFKPFGSLRRMIEATEPTVVFLDDLGQAPPAVQAACMQLLLARRIGEHKVSDQVTFVAATNRRTDRAGVGGLLEPVKSRFATIVGLEPDVEDWTRWALRAGIPTELIAYIRFQPKMLWAFEPTQDLVNTPSPRTVANVGRLMLAGIPKALEFEVFTGAVGQKFGAAFCAFLKVFRTLPSPDAILLSPATAPVPTDPGVLFALAGALAYKASDQTIGRLVTYLNRLPDEVSVYAMMEAKNKAPTIVNTRPFIEWTIAHKEVLL